MEFLRKFISRRSPWIFENSKVPVYLSKIAPIEINALSFGPFVFCRGLLTKTSRRHEIIHYHQQLEMLFIPQWILYAVFWLIGMVRYRDGATAYRENPFEREAYDNERKTTYLSKRALWSWRMYLNEKK